MSSNQPQAVTAPNIVVNNSNAQYNGYGRMRRRQSFWVHVLLFCTVPVIGNYIYAKTR